MKQLRLERGLWKFNPDSPIGKPGGFGAVFAGVGEKGEAVAIKRIHLSASEAAHRELDIVEKLLQRPLLHVIPMLDYGQDAEADTYYIVMVRAEHSLQDEIDQGKTFDEKETVNILRQIVSGLAEVRDIVHRDLKPGNVLFHEGGWKLADFGIARFIEDSTSLRTLKDWLTPHYAAPEQWQLERASSATDLYAIGCIGYTLLNGNPPFQGPDFRTQHLKQKPPSLNCQDPRLRVLVATLLKKMPDARPSLDRVIRVLGEIAEQERSVQGEGLQDLASAGILSVEASVHADADHMERAILERKRSDLTMFALETLREISEDFFTNIQKAAFDNATRIAGRSDLELLHVRFGNAALQIQVLFNGRSISPRTFPLSGWDVIAGATIYVAQVEQSKYKWGANLWYTNLARGEEYRWWEVMYMWHPLFKSHPATDEPFALTKPSDADAAAAPGIGKMMLAAKPYPIDDESVDDFYNRWAKRFAQAFKGHLQRPPRLPLDEIR